jgi:hypothetical protein
VSESPAVSAADAHLFFRITLNDSTELSQVQILHVSRYIDCFGGLSRDRRLAGPNVEVAADKNRATRDIKRRAMGVLFYGDFGWGRNRKEARKVFPPPVNSALAYFENAGGLSRVMLGKKLNEALIRASLDPGSSNQVILPGMKQRIDGPVIAINRSDHRPATSLAR